MVSNCDLLLPSFGIMFMRTPLNAYSAPWPAGVVDQLLDRRFLRLRDAADAEPARAAADEVHARLVAVNHRMAVGRRRPVRDDAVLALVTITPGTIAARP